MMSSLSSKLMPCMPERHRVISSLRRGVSTLPLIFNPLPPSASSRCREDRNEFPIPRARSRRQRRDGIYDRTSSILGACGGSFSTSSTFKRNFFYGPPSSWEGEYEELIARRNRHIIMNPLGHGHRILPGNYVVKVDPKTGVEKKVMLEHALGYFWALKELSLTDNKPILSNETVIPAAEAEPFPPLTGLVNLHDEVVDIPDFFTRNNRLADANAQCTLVAISCKEFGSRLLPSWIDPFEVALLRDIYEDDADDKYEVVRITLNEGRMAKLLSPLIASGAKKNVPSADHSRTLLFYGDAEATRDILRMHNIYTAYVFLLDGMGRVRWAGSGSGSDTEVRNMIDIARDLVRPSMRTAHRQKQTSTHRLGKKIPRN